MARILQNWTTIRNHLLFLLTLLLLIGQAGMAQAPRKPALIRDTDAAEGKEPADAAAKEKPAYNPLEAERCVQIGNYYFKQKNYNAAIQRYLEALDYQPNLFKAYDGLGRAYEKDRQFDKASDVYRDFIRKNPGAGPSAEFRSRLQKLENR